MKEYCRGVFDTLVFLLNELEGKPVEDVRASMKSVKTMIEDQNIIEFRDRFIHPQTVADTLD